MVFFRFIVLFLLFRFSRGGLFEYANNIFFGDHLQVEFWDPPQLISLNAIGKDDYVVSFGSDSGRPLDYSCGSSCSIHIEQSSTDEGSATVRVSVDLVSPPPTSTGVLQLCIGPQNTFWKRPLIDKSAISCIPWNRSFNPRKGGYLIQPNSYVEESSVLEVHTWYMTEVNYEHMKRHNMTDVLVPVFDETYWLPVVTTLYHGGAAEGIKCYFKGPFHVERVADEAKQSTYPLVYVYTNYIQALEENSGVYTVSCSGADWDEFASRTWPVELRKSLNITFFKGPKVIVEGWSGYTVPLSPQNSFNISVYSTSLISTFEVERTDGLPAMGGGLIVSQIEAQDPFSIQSRYSVELPAAVEGMSATYTVTVVNTEEESVTKNLEIIKPRALKVVVSPADEIIASEGDRVVLECIVVGDTTDHIQWTRDLGLIKDGQTEETVYSKQKGLRLVLFSVNIDDSGKYVCTASDQHKTLRTSVNLAVWPAGSPLVTDGHTHSLSTPHQLNAHTLNISEAELESEWEQHHGGLSTMALVLAGATLLAVGLILAACMLAGGFYIYQLISSSNENLDQEGANTPKISEESSEKNSKELWDLVREHSVQLDEVLSLSRHGNSEKPEQDEVQVEQLDEDTQMKQVDDVQFFDVQKTEERPEAKRKSKKSKKSRGDTRGRDGVSSSGRERQRRKERDPENRNEQAETQERRKEHKIEKSREKSPKRDKKRKQKHSSSQKQEA